jgi:RHS repeat-associated protein
MTRPALRQPARCRPRTGYCPKHASARFLPLVLADRHRARRFCTSRAIEYERTFPTTSDSSIHRYYDPATGQFLSVDPAVGLSGEPYQYAGGNPANRSDPSGLLVMGGGCLTGPPCTAASYNAWLAYNNTWAHAYYSLPGAGWKTALIYGVLAVGILIPGVDAGPDETAIACEAGAQAGAEDASAAFASEGPSGVPNFENPAASPGDAWEWRGAGEPGSTKGSWYNPETGESLHPDLSHPDPIGPHYDWNAPDGTTYRVYPDGRVVSK